MRERADAGPSDVFSFRPNVFSFRPDVFTFRANVFTLAGEAFSFRRYALVGDGARKEGEDALLRQAQDRLREAQGSSPSTGSGQGSGDAGMTGMCPLCQANVSSFLPDVSSSWPDVSHFSAECVHFGGGGVQSRPTRAFPEWSSARGGASSLRSEYLCWPSRDSQAAGADSSVQGEPGPGTPGAGNDINACNACNASSACVAGIAGRGVARPRPPGTAPRLTTNGGGPSPARTTAADASLPPAYNSFRGMRFALALGGWGHARVWGMAAATIRATTGSMRRSCRWRTTSTTNIWRNCERKG